VLGPHGDVHLWGSLASYAPIGDRYMRRLPIAAQDTILPDANSTSPRGQGIEALSWNLHRVTENVNPSARDFLPCVRPAFPQF
jgi:hypothetical protein